MLPVYKPEGFLNKEISLVDKSDQEVPLQALPYGLPPGCPLFTKNGIGVERSKNRMQQYNDIWDISKCRGLGGRGNRTDTRGLGYPEYVRDMQTKQPFLVMTEGRGRKLKGKGKKTISQPDADSGVVPPALVPLSETPQAHALLGKRKAKNKSNCLSGFIFMCNARTKPECYRNHVFGLPAGRREDVEKVKKGMKLFLFDFDMKLLYGVYVATSNGQMNLEPSAFGGRFPAQVSFAIHKECLPLRETAFKFAIRENYEGSKFKAELTRRQVKDLLLLFPALTAASVASIPQAIRVPALADQLQPSVMLPPSQDLYLAGAQPGYAAPIVEPHSVQRRVLNDPYYYAEIQRPYLAEDTAHIARDLYSRFLIVFLPICKHDLLVKARRVLDNAVELINSFLEAVLRRSELYFAGDCEQVAFDVMESFFTYHIQDGKLIIHGHASVELVDGRSIYKYVGQQQTSPPDQFAGIAAGYYSTYPTIAPQRENVAGYYTTYAIPPTSLGPPLLHHPHGEREIDLQPVDVERYYPTYPIPATSQGPPVMHPHGQVPGMPRNLREVFLSLPVIALM